MGAPDPTKITPAGMTSTRSAHGVQRRTRRYNERRLSAPARRHGHFSGHVRTRTRCIILETALNGPMSTGGCQRKCGHMTKTYTIRGVDRHTGEDRTMTIDAADRATAELDAHRAGVTVASSLPPVPFESYGAQNEEESVGATAIRASSNCSWIARMLALTIVGLPLSLVFWLASVHFKTQAKQIYLLEQIAKSVR